MNPAAELLPTFERFKQALFDVDTKGLQEIVADDYQGFDPQGQPQNKEMVLEAYRPGGVSLDRYDVEDTETRIIGEVGIVTGKGLIQGRYGEFEFAHHVRFLDIYLRRDDQWRLYLSQVTPLIV